MSRRMMASALVLIGLVAVIALGQPPSAGQSRSKKPAPGPDAATTKARPADDAVAGALANDPDVQVAKARILLAEAELAKAKQAVVLKVMTLKATIQELKSTLAAAEERVAWAARMVEKGQAPQRQMLDERAKLESAKAALDRAQTELKLLTGAGMEAGASADPGASDLAVQRGLLWLSRQALHDPSPEANSFTTSQAALAALYLSGFKTPAGAVPDRIRAALDKPVRIGTKGKVVPFDEAMEIFKKEAGLDVAVRFGANTLAVGSITSEGEELPVGAWFQLYQDAALQGSFYVRDYGLLFCHTTTAPPDAPTLTEFWKQKPVKTTSEPPKK